ncbi:MAG: glutamate-5-semialdehyde dehydrogenase [Candidatus Omnitrophota bacterium]
MALRENVLGMARAAKSAESGMALLPTETKNAILGAMASALRRGRRTILKANARDLSAMRRKGRSGSIIDRLSLNAERVEGMAKGLEEIMDLKDCVGEIDDFDRRPNGLLIGKMRVPIGVIAVIYEARPNVTADCIGLCLKSGNVTILRGGSEAINSNKAIFDILRAAGEKNGMPASGINIVESTDRKAVDYLLGLTGIVDLVIPRGGESLIKEVVKKAKVPVIKHYKGVCHVYVDEFADLNIAERIAFNAKVQRPGVCNAMETLLVHDDVAARFLPSLAERLKEAGCEIRGCGLTRKIVRDAERAAESDWYEEYLDLILAVRVVKSIDEAIGHIRKYGSMHSDAIVTENYDNAMRFIREVDSACVYVNASTRFTDGNQFGMGAEMGISTDKIHARGPMGLRELTSYKYVILGSGQIRQ